ncbi:alpha/beta fold hydrolase [Leclercia adecarboxylata]|uniref:alpha/beta fold hydrolase n=1 Tax=Leclercia adecarboxylata TaxID=83655 RepID=UPI0021D2A0DB|nr:alpha/beta hydrolase [Leclercia adecarboxylata]MCU6675683.1 alpha/beta hydrolase [Leclercia adecarboxylata]MCV3303468.1 alpha/beta hydrolase [Leclercia adecarboxylata]MCV3307272.1 alpha/beta hydrolase [Leclercia adecarboxylata]
MYTATIRTMIGGTFFLMLALVSTSAAQSLPTPAEHPNSQRISVQTQGSGTDVILIPGLASSRDVWTGLAADLRKSHRIHLVELAGFASTPAISNPDGKVIAPAVDAIAEYIRTQHLKAPVIIGHSLGGEIALMLGARHPDLVSRLMVVDALPFYTLMIDPTATRETAAQPATRMRDWLLSQSPEQRAEFQTTSIARLVKTDAVRPALVAAGINSDPKTVADAVYELMMTDLRPELGHIKAPIEVVYAYDPLFGIPAASVDSMYRQAYASAKEIHFTRIDDSFHFVMLDQPERFSGAVATFLKE